jgi:ribonuclease III
MNLSQLEEKLGYLFLNKESLSLACTHRSYSRDNNERLEFLGDVVLSATVSEYLYKNEMQLTEGELTRRRAMLVNGKTLVQIAQSIDLGAHLFLGGSELVGGRERASILEDALEAILAAVYLDGGWSAVTAVIMRLWSEKLQERIEDVEKDAKTQLQEWLQARSLPLPVYEVEIVGPGHKQVFTATCRVVGIDGSYSGEGSTRRQAEQVAAKNMQQNLEKQ